MGWKYIAPEDEKAKQMSLQLGLCNTLFTDDTTATSLLDARDSP